MYYTIKSNIHNALSLPALIECPCEIYFICVPEDVLSEKELHICMYILFILSHVLSEKKMYRYYFICTFILSQCLNICCRRKKWISGILLFICLYSLIIMLSGKQMCRYNFIYIFILASSCLVRKRNIQVSSYS